MTSMQPQPDTGKLIPPYPETTDKIEAIIAMLRKHVKHDMQVLDHLLSEAPSSVMRGVTRRAMTRGAVRDWSCILGQAQELAKEIIDMREELGILRDEYTELTAPQQM